MERVPKTENRPSEILVPKGGCLIVCNKTVAKIMRQNKVQRKIKTAVFCKTAVFMVDDTGLELQKRQSVWSRHLLKCPVFKGLQVLAVLDCTAFSWSKLSV